MSKKLNPYRKKLNACFVTFFRFKTIMRSLHSKKFGFLLPKHSVSKNQRKFLMFCPKFRFWVAARFSRHFAWFG
jgi:hypothetical protein